MRSAPRSTSAIRCARRAGFVCEVSDDAEIDLTGALRIGETIGGGELVVNGTRLDVARLYDVWSQPLRELYP